jgi:carbon-monoxide dehydrogenase small subunit
MKELIRLKINGDLYEVWIEPWRTLVDVIREDIGLTGTKEACSTGECGSCAVLVNGKPVNACLMLAVEMQDEDIVTIEGLSQEGTLHPLQEAFVKHGAIQCGFCTSGMILTAKALLDNNPRPTKGEVKEAISGNLCRCTGYVKIVEAILEAGKENNQRG